MAEKYNNGVSQSQHHKTHKSEGGRSKLIDVIQSTFKDDVKMQKKLIDTLNEKEVVNNTPQVQ